MRLFCVVLVGLVETVGCFIGAYRRNLSHLRKGGRAGIRSWEEKTRGGEEREASVSGKQLNENAGPVAVAVGPLRRFLKQRIWNM